GTCRSPAHPPAEPHYPAPRPRRGNMPAGETSHGPGRNTPAQPPPAVAAAMPARATAARSPDEGDAALRPDRHPGPARGPAAPGRTRPGPRPAARRGTARPSAGPTAAHATGHEQRGPQDHPPPRGGGQARARHRTDPPAPSRAVRPAATPPRPRTAGRRTLPARDLATSPAPASAA